MNLTTEQITETNKLFASLNTGTLTVEEKKAIATAMLNIRKNK